MSASPIINLLAFNKNFLFSSQKLAFSDDEQPVEHSHRDRERERDKDYSQQRVEERRDVHKKQNEPVEKMEPAVNDNRVPQMMPNRGWNNPRQASQPATPQQNRNQQIRRNEDDELWEQRRRQQSEEVAIAVERAKLRKEEEEKRYLETKQAAAKKLQELENKIKEKKGEEIIREVINENDNQGTINPSQIPPQPITPAPIPVPEWDRDRETRERSRTPNEPTEKHQTREADFRQLTQIEGRSFVTKNSRSSEREISRDRDVRDREPRDMRERDRENRERDAPNFSRQFQSNLPPRFQKQQAERQNTTGNYHRGAQSGSPQPQNPPNPNVPFAQQYDPRWVQNNANFPGKGPNTNNPRRKDEHENETHQTGRERRDRHTPDTERNYSDSNRRISGGDRYYDDYRNYRREGSQEYEYKHERSEEKWEKDHRGHYEERKDKKEDSFDSHDIHRQDSGEWRREKYISHKESSEERSSDRNQDGSQRPDSRDSRISKDSLRDVNEYTCWADSPFEPTYEDNKKKEPYREERRQVPGPITKDRIEADDLKTEKRNLIQLKRSDNKLDKKHEENEKKTDDPNKKKVDEPKSWADQVTPQGGAPDKLMEALEKKKPSNTGVEITQKKDIPEKDDSKHPSSRTRIDSRGSNSHRGNWGSSGSGTVYNSSWPKRGDTRSSRGSQRSSGRRHKDMAHSDSEFSGDEFSVSTESGKEDRTNKHTSQKPNQSPKPLKKSEKEDKNKDKQTEKGDYRRGDRRFDTNSRDRDRDRDRDRHRDPYIPRGEPTRHGRGGFRGSRPVVSSKRIDGYGIPPSKSPFGNHDEKDMKKHHSGDEIGGEAVSSDEKTKLNQQALAAGIIGSSRNPKSDNQVPPRIQRQKDDRTRDRSKGRTHSGSRKPKPRSKHSDENWETSDYSDTDDRKDRGKRKPRSNPPAPYQSSRGPSAPLRSNSNQSNNPRRDNLDTKKGSFGSKNEPNLRQNSSSNLRSSEKGTGKPKEDGKETNTFAAAIENVKQVKEKIERSDSGENAGVSEEANSDEKSFDTDGFQEVKSKKNVIKERKDDKVPPRNVKPELKDRERDIRGKYKSSTTQLTPQQIANIPPLLATPVNPPSNMNPQSNNKSSFARQNKLAPRFAKQRENRMAKQQLQNICDVTEMNKINQNVTMYSMKDGTTPPQVNNQVTNAWEKPITTQLRNSVDPEALLNMGVDNCPELDPTQQSQTSSQRSSPNTEKLIPKAQVGDNKALLDGTTPPVNTIIFENTNYKSAPVTPPTDLAVKAKFNTQIKTGGPPRPTDSKVPQQRKLDETEMENQVMTGFNKPISDILNKNENKNQPEPIQMPLSFNKAEDNADMKLDFTFDSDLTQLTDDKSSKSLGLPRSMHAMTSAQSTISPSTADLNFKIASVKKVNIIFISIICIFHIYL